MRRSRRNRTKVNYSVGDIDEGEGRLGGIVEAEDSSDEFVEPDDKEDADIEMSDDDRGDLDSDRDNQDETDKTEVSSQKSRGKSSLKRSKTGHSNGSGINDIMLGSPLRPSRPKPASKGSDTLRERFQLFFGPNDKLLVEAIRNRKIWGSLPFLPVSRFFAEPILLADPPNNTGRIVGNQQLEQASHPLNENVIKFQPELGSETEELLAFNSYSSNGANDRQKLYIYAGRPVSCLSWAPGHQNSVQYLAVGVLGSSEQDANGPASPLLSAFSSDSYQGIVEIYRLDIINDIASPRLTLALEANFGSVVNLAWRPIDTLDNPNAIGILAAVYDDGALRVYDVKYNPEHLHYHVNQPLLQYRIENCNITCCAWRTTNEIVVGTSVGTIAEFDVTDNSEMGNIPSFVWPVHSSLISAINTAYPQDSNLILTGSTDGYSKIIDVRDIERSITLSSRVKGYSTCSCYSRHMNSFLSLEDSVTGKVMPSRKPNILQGGTAISRHTGSVTALATSPIHPFVLSGGAEGQIKVGNLIRRCLVSKRQATSFYKTLTLWQLEYNEKTKVFRFTDTLDVEVISRAVVEKLSVFPYQAAITSLSWNPSVYAGGWYAAGTRSGLIRLGTLSSD